MTSATIPGLDTAPTNRQGLLSWVEEVAELTQPDRVVFADGSDEEFNRLAAQLVEATRGEDPRMLDLLARAYAGTGNFEHAVETETRALNLLPRDLRSDLKEEIETNLAEFRSGPASSRARRKAQ